MLMMGSTSAANGWGGEGSLPANVALGKRKADESTVNDSERFAKRFNLLSLGEWTSQGVADNTQHTDVVGAADARARNNNSNYYIPVPPPRSSAASSADAAAATTTPHHAPPITSSHAPPEEHMQLDDTRDRVFIYNLDEELADEEPEADEERLIFLPDIEKKFSRIPLQVLTGRRDEHENQELVLYDVPNKSLTGDAAGHDSVRKAILEARHRARERAIEEARQHDMNCKYDTSAAAAGDADTETAHGYSAGYHDHAEEPDVDAMDMD